MAVIRASLVKIITTLPLVLVHFNRFVLGSRECVSKSVKKRKSAAKLYSLAGLPAFRASEPRFKENRGVSLLAIGLHNPLLL